MAYRYDKDLEFLKELSSPELDELVKILTHDKDGKVRFTEELTNNDLYKKHYPDHKEYIELILEEFQKFGGNSILNIFRGGGVLYNEILRDVAKKFDVKFDENESTNSIETSLLCKLIEEELKNSQDENTLRELVNIFELGISNINKQTVVMGLQSLIKIGGFKSYQIAVIVANQVMKVLLGRGLSLAANATLTRALSLFSGPVGWTIMTTWTALDLASPAYRVTIPAVLQIIILRLKHNTKN